MRIGDDALRLAVEDHSEQLAIAVTLARGDAGSDRCRLTARQKISSASQLVNGTWAVANHTP